LSKYHTKESLETYLLWDFDFSYRYDNDWNLLSTGKEQGILTTSAAEMPSLLTNLLDVN